MSENTPQMPVEQGFLTHKSSHPKGLAILFFAELWERFSFYGMRALLVLYMTSELLFHDAKAYGVYGAYGAMVYGSQIIGGYIADQFLGCRRAIYLGGIIIALGHLILSFATEMSMFMGLSFIIIGTGFFKPNISALLGKLYKKNDPRRDGGFTIFYMGINVGGLIAPLVCGYLGEVYGWHYGFGAAAFGMIAGIFVFVRGQKLLGDAGLPPNPERLDKGRFLGLTLNHIIIIGTLVTMPVFLYVLSHNEFTKFLLNFLGIGTLLYILYIAFKSSAEERKCLLTILFMLPFIMIFVASFEQCGSSMNLFADRNVDRFLFGWQIPTPWFQSLNPIFIIVCAPLFSGLWTFLGKRNLDPYTPVKFSFGLIQTGLGFGALLLGIQAVGASGYVPMVWLVLAYFFHSTGELCLSPVGLSMVTKLAPARFVSLMMGVFFLSFGFASYVAGLIATLASTPEGCSIEIDKSVALLGYAYAFEVVFYSCIGSGLLIFLLSPLFKGIFKRHQ